MRVKSRAHNLSIFDRYILVYFQLPEINFLDNIFQIISEGFSDNNYN